MYLWVVLCWCLCVYLSVFGLLSLRIRALLLILFMNMAGVAMGEKHLFLGLFAVLKFFIVSDLAL